MTTTTQSKPAAPLVFCSEEGCKEPALFTYVWPWGVQGACCSLHRVHVQQRSDALDRGQVNFTAIDPGRTAPLARDERTQLIAARMSAEQDHAEASARGAELYRANNELTDQLRRSVARNNEVEAQLRDRKADVDRLTAERDRALADAGEAQTEVARLKPLVAREPLAPSFPPARG
jgi:hypothetical protein